MSQRIRSSLRARIVLAFVLFGAVLGLAFMLVGWLAHGAFHALSANLARTVAVTVSGGVVIAILGWIIGRIVAHRVLGPLEALGEVVEGSPPERLVETLAECTYDREVGVLALRLEDAMRRLQDFVDRERRFTRYVSHELRSPAAVIRGAAELLSALPEAEVPRVERPLARINRSVADMQEIIEAFLWLGREPADHETEEMADVVATVESVIGRYEHILEGKPVSVKIEATARPTVPAPGAVLGVVIGNLVANSFRYTNQGEVVIAIEEHAIEVRDSGVGMEQDSVDACTQSFWRGLSSEGHGIGLSIVRSLSERFGWRLWIDSQPGVGTTTKLYF